MGPKNMIVVMMPVFKKSSLLPELYYECCSGQCIYKTKV